MSIGIETATVFTPGRASYVDEAGLLQLTDASLRRADVARVIYDPRFHDKAVFAGGFPGMAQGWDESLTPPEDRREAHLMALPLKERLRFEGRSQGYIDAVVKTQGESSDSFGDVIRSVELGLLDPAYFNDHPKHGVELVAGFLHGAGRFRSILSRALDIDPSRIRRVQMRDVYGTPAFPLKGVVSRPASTLEVPRVPVPRRPPESASKAVAVELAAIAITQKVLLGVKRGDLEGLRNAREEFAAVAKKLTG